MINIDWSSGNLCVENIRPYFDEYDQFEIVIGENDIPFSRTGLEYDFTYKCLFKFYIEYHIKVYGINKKTKHLELISEKKFDCKNKNMLVQLEPKTQIELDMWLSYLENFVEKRNCNLYIKLINTNRDLTITKSNLYKEVENDNDIHYYGKYKVCWDTDYFLNPKGIFDISSYELINNIFLRI